MILTLAQVNLHRWVSLDEYRRVSKVDDAARAIRKLREQGYQFEQNGRGEYRLTAMEPGPARNDGEVLSGRVRVEAMVRDGHRCRWCGRSAGETNELGEIVRLQVDHVFPRHLGGASVLLNAQTLCQRCNGEKQAWLVPPP